MSVAAMSAKRGLEEISEDGKSSPSQQSEGAVIVAATVN